MAVTGLAIVAKVILGPKQLTLLVDNQRRVTYIMALVLIPVLLVAPDQ